MCILEKNSSKMNQKVKERKTSLQTIMGGRKRVRPIPKFRSKENVSQDEDSTTNTFNTCTVTEPDTLTELQPVKEETKVDIVDETPDQDEDTKLVQSEVERFIEISKYFSNPLRRTASYICENRLVSYPNPFRIEYKRGGVTTQHIKFCNLTLEPVYIKLYKLIPDLEQIKYINLNLSRCKRIPPGLSFNLGFVYDDVEEKPSCNSKMIVVASRKTTTPCYQICEIQLSIEAQKVTI